MKFNPDNHTVREVLDHAIHHPEDVVQILLDETMGKNRLTVIQTLIIDLGAQLHHLQEHDFETRIRKMHEREPSMTMTRALRILDEGIDTLNAADCSFQEIGEWILEQDDIVELLVDKKIMAIKEVRARTQLGLKEAKEGVEEAIYLQSRGHLTSKQRKQLEIEEQAAIASILGA